MNDPVYVVADIGGTHARFAYVIGKELSLNGIQVLTCADYTGLAPAIQKYLNTEKLVNINGYCLAVAGRTDRPVIKLTNNSWQFEVDKLVQQLGIPVLIINDFVANAHALSVLQKDQYQWLSNAGSVVEESRLIIGCGTGLGMAIVTKGGEVLASEGGHIGFAPHTRHESMLLSKLLERYQRVSIEKVLSGNGLSNLYWAHSLLHGAPAELSPCKVVEQAAGGDPLACHAIKDFFNILASFISDMALVNWAKGGVYLTGGVLEKLWPFYDQQAFLRRVSDKGRFSDFCADLPVARITTEYPGMLGCAYNLRRQLVKQQKKFKGLK